MHAYVVHGTEVQVSFIICLSNSKLFLQLQELSNNKFALTLIYWASFFPIILVI